MSPGATIGGQASDPGRAPGLDARPRPGRIGIFGGTFDPPHVAHLAVAEEAREALGLDRVIFVPAGQPWQKADRPISPAPARLAMVERAVAANPAFAVDGREVERPGPSYTVETLEVLAAGGVATPGVVGGAGTPAEAAGAGAPAFTAARGATPPELWFILSAEALRGFATWREPGRILELARLCVVPRGASGPATADAVELLRAQYLGGADRVVALDRPRLEISSSEIRDRVRAGRSVRYLVPDGVIALIAEYALYAGPTPGRAPDDA